MVLGSDKDLQKVWVEPVGIVGYAGVVVLLPQLGPGNILIRNHSNMNELSTLSFLDFLDRIFCSQPFTECVAQDSGQSVLLRVWDLGLPYLYCCIVSFQGVGLSRGGFAKPAK